MCQHVSDTLRRCIWISPPEGLMKWEKKTIKKLISSKNAVLRESSHYWVTLIISLSQHGRFLMVHNHTHIHRHTDTHTHTHTHTCTAHAVPGMSRHNTCSITNNTTHMGERQGGGLTNEWVHGEYPMMCAAWRARVTSPDILYFFWVLYKQFILSTWSYLILWIRLVFSMDECEWICWVRAARVCVLECAA